MSRASSALVDDLDRSSLLASRSMKRLGGAPAAPLGSGGGEGLQHPCDSQLKELMLAASQADRKMASAAVKAGVEDDDKTEAAKISHFQPDGSGSPHL